jgi:UDP-N-acetylmuramyl tripeptide synthase
MQQTLSLVSFGPGRRSDRPVHELVLTLEPGEAERLARLTPEQCQERLSGLHPVLRIDAGRIDLSALAPSPLASLYVGLVLALQRAAGHRVGEVGLIESSPVACRFWFEYEEPETSAQAVELAQQAITTVLDSNAARSNLAERIDRFLSEAGKRAMPVDVGAIAAAARQRGIPVLRMDRPPYDPIRGPFRLRPHGLLRLGHGHGQQTVDGTFAVSRSEPVFRLIRDRAALFGQMEKLGLPLAEAAADWQHSPNRAGRQAEALGYPVIVRSDRRGAGFRHAWPCQNRDQVAQMSTLALGSGQRVLVQRHAPGRAHEVLVAGGLFLACQVAVEEEGQRRWRRFEDLHESIRQLAEQLAATLDVGLLQMSVVTTDPAQPLAQSGGKIVDLDLAPRLDRLFSAGDPLLTKAAEDFIDWLFPEPAAARLPIIAVTGTNGKTTTTRLLASIAAAAGFRAGEAGSEGCWVAGEKVSDYEDGHIYGHTAVLDHPATEFAVLESTRGAVATSGLGFERCDAAICLNVTADHLGDLVGLERVEDLAELKRAIVERADRAIVLNADDRHCLAMAEMARGRRLGLVSLIQPAAALLARTGPGGAAAVLETVDDREWLVLHGDGQRCALMAADELPIAYAATARFNLENALHAALAAWLLGIEPKAIARGLVALPTGYDGVPGRLNFREDLPFRVCMDYAHNPGGIRALCEFVDRQNVSGRKILCFSSSNGNADELIRETGEAAAGHFDVYICKNFGLLFDRQPEESPGLLREGLIRGGVAPEQIQCVFDEFDAFDQALGMGRPGDLVVLIGGKRRQALWDHVMAF